MNGGCIPSLGLSSFYDCSSHELKGSWPISLIPWSCGDAHCLFNAYVSGVDWLARNEPDPVLRQDGLCNVRFMTYEQEVIIKCAIKGTLGGLDRKMTSEELDELLNGSQDWRKHLVIEEITEVATIHAGRRRPELDSM